ncbi:MAG TPA: DUF2087 domain-containing protein [Selenomonadales bacterium]|nr:DUF2087 domain-containing protein [Selenomonadales bacterium]
MDNNFTDLFWQASLEELKRGYLYSPATEEYICLACGARFVRGTVYPLGSALYEAGKMTELHVEQAHGSAFQFLLSLDKKLTGLTDHQRRLLELFHRGLTDGEIAKEADIGSTSTIRNHRFVLREKQKQAKVFLAIMELLERNTPKRQTFIGIPRSARQVDERFAITQEENEKVLAQYLPQGPGGPLATFPAKEKRKVIILKHLHKQFEPGKKYTEQQVNGILQAFYPDYATLRRYLIEYGFMDRTPDGGAYWVLT